MVEPSNKKMLQAQKFDTRLITFHYYLVTEIRLFGANARTIQFMLFTINAAHTRRTIYSRFNFLGANVA